MNLNYIKNLSKLVNLNHLMHFIVLRSSDHQVSGTHKLWNKLPLKSFRYNKHRLTESDCT